jgi:hypothetical protein
MYLKTNPLWLYCYKLKISKIPYDQRFEGYSMRLRLSHGTCDTETEGC